MHVPHERIERRKTAADRHQQLDQRLEERRPAPEPHPSGRVVGGALLFCKRDLPGNKSGTRSRCARTASICRDASQSRRAVSAARATTKSSVSHSDECTEPPVWPLPAAQSWIPPLLGYNCRHNRQHTDAAGNLK